MSKSGAPIRIIFMGTPDFAIPTLLSLRGAERQSNLRVIAVITQPDRPVGRTQILTPPPVKVAAAKLGLPVMQPEKLRGPKTVEQISELKPDLIVVAAFGQIIPKSILEVPQYGALNVHPSLLPKYRGASPIQGAIANGDAETGVTIMLLDDQLDHGPILAQSRVPITQSETGGSLGEKLARVGAELLIATLPEWVAGNLKPQEQDHSQATTTKLLMREDGKINWNQPAEAIERTIRAYDRWPGTWTVWERKRLNILKAVIPGNVEGSLANASPGTIFKTTDGFAIICSKFPPPLMGGVGEGGSVLEILELQPEGKRPMTAADFLRGHPEILGAVLSS